MITATQMLESMMDNPLPTRAEVADVANAVLDGTDAVMLSDETAVGKHPVETVRRMAAIAETAEEKLYPFDRSVRPRTATEPPDLPSVLARLAAQATREVEVKAIVVFTRSGRTAQLLSDERPRPPILALSPSPEVVRQLALYWGVRPRPTGDLRSATALIAAGREALLQAGLARAGEIAVFLIGSAEGDTENGLEIARL